MRVLFHSVCLLSFTWWSIVDGLSPSLSRTILSRRRLFRQGLLSSGGVAVVTLGSPEEASAARGAAELDLEYYLRDLLGGNRPEGNILPSSPPAVDPPRTLSPLAVALLNDDCSAECLATRLLIERLQQTQLRSGTAPTESKALEEMIQQRVRIFRDGAKKSFYSRAPWIEEQVRDQYYFDLTAYAFWKVAAAVLPNFFDRDNYMRSLGRRIYQKLREDGLLKSNSDGKKGLVDTITGLDDLLSIFVQTNLCKAYRLGEKMAKSDEIVFLDEIDDQAFQQGASVDCLISVFESATLGASLQITGEQSRFIPDFVGPTVAAMWEDQLGEVKCTWESYFVDPEYRPNPKDFFPNEQLYQFTLNK